MEDEIIEINNIDETTEKKQADEQVDEQVEEQIEEKKTIKVFDPNEVKFDDNLGFSGYNLEKFKDDIDMTDDSVRALEAFTAEYQKLGLSQEQVEGIIGFMISQNNQTMSPEAITENLKNNLSYEEKKSYQANCNILKNILKGTEEEKYFNAITSDPGAIKILTKVINHFQGGKNVNGIKEREERNISRNLTADEGIAEFNKYILMGGKDIEKKRKEIQGKLLNKEELEYFNQITE